MTGRDKILAALSERGTTSVPVVLAYPEIFMRECWERVTRVPWWGMFSQDIPLTVEVYRDMFAVTGEDRIRIFLSPPRAERTRFVVEGIDARRARRVDRETGAVEEILRPPPGGFVSTYDEGFSKDREYTSREQIDAALPLVEVETREALESAGRLDKPRALMEAFPDKMPWTQLPSPWDPLFHIWGFEGLMVACADRPDLVAHAARRVAENTRRRMATWKAAGIELIWLEEGSSDMISPELYRRLILPALQETTDDLRRAGLKSIHYYTGNPNDRLDMLLESGADALALEGSRKGFVVDIAEVAARAQGRMALVGNLDEMGLLERGPVAAIRAEVRRQLAAGRRNGGRFLMGIGGPITPGTPLEHVRAIAETVEG